jgi:hypothetical protein
MTEAAGAPPSPTGAPPTATTRPGRRGSVVLAVAVVVLAASLALPWWSASETFGGESWDQTYSPLGGVVGVCAPSCGAFDVGPPTGPIAGRHSFSGLGLNETGVLYEATLGLVVAGLGTGALALVLALREREAAGSLRSRRLGLRALAAAVALAGVATATLAILQPYTLRADTDHRLSQGSTWTASPSPETSFFGACSRGVDHGLCTSGGSAIRGPDWGWMLLVAAVVLLAIAFRSAVRAARSA